MIKSTRCKGHYVIYARKKESPITRLDVPTAFTDFKFCAMLILSILEMVNVIVCIVI